MNGWPSGYYLFSDYDDFDDEYYADDFPYLVSESGYLLEDRDEAGSRPEDDESIFGPDAYRPFLLPEILEDTPQSLYEEIDEGHFGPGGCDHLMDALPLRGMSKSYDVRPKPKREMIKGELLAPEPRARSWKALRYQERRYVANSFAVAESNEHSDIADILDQSHIW